MKYAKQICLLGFTLFWVTSFSLGEDKLKLLLLDGQNNHAWKETSPVMVAILEESGRFDVTVSTTPASPPRAPRRPKNKMDEAAKAKFVAQMKEWQTKSARIKTANLPKWDLWRPAFSEYDVVVSNYNGEDWPAEVKTAFEKYVSDGGGFVSVHAADNSFPNWTAYNEMIAVGGWGGRTIKSGSYLRLRDGNWIPDASEGKSGAHGPQREFLVETRDANHPIMKGLPAKWLHAKDELYDRLRGPAKNVTVLASAFADESLRGSGEHEPVIMVIDYGNGRCVHTTLGHSKGSMMGIGFQETLKRGAEWAATGKVTFPDISAETMTADKVAFRKVDLETSASK